MTKHLVLPPLLCAALWLNPQLDASADTHPLKDGTTLVVDEKADIILQVPVEADAKDADLEKITRVYAPTISQEEIAVILEDREIGQPLEIPWQSLSPGVRAAILREIFPNDHPTERGTWMHVVSTSDESFSMISRLFHKDDDLILDLFTRLGRDIEKADEIELTKDDMDPDLFQAIMRLSGVEPITKKPTDGDFQEDHSSRRYSKGPAGNRHFIPLPPAKDGLVYKRAGSGEIYSVYTVRRGDSLYSIARRFTKRTRPKRINAAVRVIQRASKLAKASRIKPGDKVVIPGSLLGGEYSIPPEQAEVTSCKGPLPQSKGPLRFVRLDNGRIEARYRLKKGEALYSAVVIRFTGRLRAKEVNGLAMLIAKYSGITDVTKIPAGAIIRIPAEYLDDPWQPCATPAEEGTEAEIQEETPEPEPAPAALAGQAKGLHFILDPGHGGIDSGAVVGGMPEDEYAYDIASRLKRHLEHAGGTVHMLLYDRKQKYRPRNIAFLKMDRNEVLLTKPRWFPNNPRRAVMVRVAMVNKLVRELTKKGVKRDEIAFLSIHLDNLHPSVMGSFAYYPNKVMRRKRLVLGGGTLSRLFSAVDRRLDFNSRFLKKSQRKSRRTAYRIVRALRAAGFPMTRRPVRYKIYRGRRVFSPAVVRYSAAERALLIETFNLANERQRKLLAKPGKRELYARTLGDALIAELKGRGKIDMPPPDKDRGRPRLWKKRGKKKRTRSKKRR